MGSASSAPSAQTPPSGPVRALGAAVASLSVGAGPAHGASLSCTPTSGQSAVCGSSAVLPRPALITPPAWTNLTLLEAASTPSSRALGSMVWDAADGYVLLYAGCSVWTCSGSPLSDTWIFQDNHWTDLTGSLTTSPPALSIAPIAYDPVDKEVVMFGGLGPTSSYSLNQTWVFSGGQWTNLTPNLTVSPPARYRAAMTWDAKDGYVLMFGGTYDTSTTSPYSDTWTFVNQTWTNITKKVTGGPPGRLRASMAYDVADGYVILFGGCTATTCPSGDTWKYVNDTWTDLTSSLTKAPSARVYFGLTYDARDGYLLLYGGGGSTSGPGLADTWKFSNGNWTNITSSLSVAPTGRLYEMLAYDANANYSVLFSGYNTTSASLLNDTWAFGPPIIAEAQVSPVSMDLGQSTTISVIAAADATPLNFSYRGLPQGCASQNSSQLACAPSVVGNFSVTANITDTVGNSVELGVSFSVGPDPAIAAFGATPTTVTAGSPVLLQVSATGGIVPYRYTYHNLPTGCTSADRSNLTCVTRTAGTYRVEAQLTDSAGFSAFANASFQVNPLPSIVSFTALPAELDAGQRLTLWVNTSGGTPPLTYVYSGLPPGCTSVNSSSLNCTPSGSALVIAKVQVTDAFGWSAESNVSITVNPALGVQSLAAVPSTIDLGQKVAFWLNATGGTAPYAYDFAGLPAGCALVNVAFGTCTPLAIGNFSVTGTVTDNTGAKASATLLVTVVPAPLVTAFTATPSPTDIGVNTTFTASLAGGIPPVTISYSSLPIGCASENSPSLTCAPLESGTFTVAVRIVDASGLSSTLALTLRVNAAPSIRSFSASPYSVSLGETTTLTVEGAGGTGTYSYQYAGLPTGCRGQNASSISCQPSVTGAFTVSVTITDAVGKTARGTTSVIVTPKVTTLLGLPTTTAYALIGLLVAIAVIAAVVAVVLMRRRRSGSGSTPPAASTEEPAPEGDTYGGEPPAY